MINKLLVCGSRSITDKQWIWNILDQYQFQTLIVGTDEKVFKSIPIEQYHVDIWAYKYAKKNKKHIIPLVPDWKKFDISAGVIRNSQMVSILEENDWGIALWDGKSAGTSDTINKLRKCKKLLHVHLYKIKSLETFLSEMKK